MKPISDIQENVRRFNEDEAVWRRFHTFKTKQNATKGGVIKKLLGKEGGSVKIQKENGRFQEERTYPGSKDPKSSKG